MAEEIIDYGININKNHFRLRHGGDGPSGKAEEGNPYILGDPNNIVDGNAETFCNFFTENNEFPKTLYEHFYITPAFPFVTTFYVNLFVYPPTSSAIKIEYTKTDGTIVTLIDFSDGIIEVKQGYNIYDYITEIRIICEHYMQSPRSLDIQVPFCEFDLKCLKQSDVFAKTRNGIVNFAALVEGTSDIAYKDKNNVVQYLKTLTPGTPESRILDSGVRIKNRQGEVLAIAKCL